jgi:hypothetical protein
MLLLPVPGPGVAGRQRVALAGGIELPGNDRDGFLLVTALHEAHRLGHSYLSYAGRSSAPYGEDRRQPFPDRSLRLGHVVRGNEREDEAVVPFIAVTFQVAYGVAEWVAQSPLMAPGRRYTRYHRAVRDLDRPRLFENRLCYRLVDVSAGSPWGSPEQVPAFAISDMSYFDMIDVGEALAHEAAMVAVDSRGNMRPDRLEWASLPFRRLVRDPFDLIAYPLMLSVSTLTVRRSPAGSTFLLLRRNPTRVAIAGGMKAATEQVRQRGRRCHRRSFRRWRSRPNLRRRCSAARSTPTTCQSIPGISLRSSWRFSREAMVSGWSGPRASSRSARIRS